MAIQQISVFLENRPAQLLKLTDVIRKNGIDIRALSLSETTDFGIAHFIVNQPYDTAEILKKQNFIAKLTPVIAVRLNDKAGSLHKILEILAEANINLEYSYVFVMRKLGSACSVLRVDDIERAEELFKEKGIELIEDIDAAQ